MARCFAVRCLLLYVLTTCVLGSHFRGAIFMARPSPGGGENEMEVFFQISWRRGSAFCNQSVIDSGILIGESGDLDCLHGCSESPIANVTFMCTAFSIEEDWSFGERRFSYTFNETSDVTLAYTGGNWIRPFNSDWSILTSFSTAKRNDTGRINSTPRAITSPVVRLQENCNHTIRIPVTDPDNDIVRCRWAVGFTECGGICDGFPGAVLDPDSCSIMYTAVQGVGFQAAAIVIEDFLPGSTVPMSSVGLQFLVLIVSGSCSVAPEFIPPTPEDDSCVVIPPGGTFHTMLVAVSGNENDTITEIQTVSPAGLRKSDLFHDEDSNAFYVNITWTPTTQQENATHLFCYTAINSAGLSSSQVCIELLAGHTAPAPIPGSAAPNMELVDPSGTTWRINFDTDIEPPSTSAYITFHEFDTDVVVHRIDTSSSSEVVFANGSMIALTPDHVFEENREYYINFDREVVIGIDRCEQGNEPVTGRQFWTFNTTGQPGRKVNDSIIADPLFTVTLPDDSGYSLCYEVHGKAGKFFNLVSDTCVSVNAHFTAINQARNRMSSIGIHAVTNDVRSCIDIEINLACFAAVDGDDIGNGTVIDGVRIRRYKNHWRVSVPNCNRFSVMWVTCLEEELRLTISRRSNLQPSSHGLLGQFWNIPIFITTVNGDSYIEVYDPGHEKYRRFPALFHELVWDHSFEGCYYAGNSQGGPESNYDSVIEGFYTQYATKGLFDTSFQYKQFDDDRCLP